MIGYRHWDLDETGTCLVGNYGAEWHGKMAKSDKEPSRDNQSGIYADKNFSSIFFGIYGAVDLSGKILVHSDGIIRGQYANILWLTLAGYDDGDEKESLERDLKRFCYDKDIVFFESGYVERKIEETEQLVGAMWMKEFGKDTLTVPAMDGMFAMITRQIPLDYGIYAKVRFRILRDSLDYRILDKLSDRSSISYAILMKLFLPSSNYFLKLHHSLEYEESLYRMDSLIDKRNVDNDVYVSINDKGVEVLNYIKQHGYYSYNTKEARFSYRNSRVFLPRARVRLLSYKINGKYKMIYNGLVSEEMECLEDVLDSFYNGGYSFLCQGSIEDKEEELDSISGYYEIYSHGDRTGCLHHRKNKEGKYPNEWRMS